MYTDGTTGFTQAKCSLLGSDFLGHHCCILPALFHRRESLPSRCSESLHIASSWLYEWWLFGWSLMAGILKIKKKTRKKEAPLLWGETPHLCYVETEGKKERKKERREGRKKESVWCGVLCLTSPSYHVSYNEISLFKLSLCLKCFLVPNLVHSEQVSFSFIEVSLITRHFFFYPTNFVITRVYGEMFERLHLRLQWPFFRTLGTNTAFQIAHSMLDSYGLIWHLNPQECERHSDNHRRRKPPFIGFGTFLV